MEKSKALARANWKGSGDKSVEENGYIREELKPNRILVMNLKKLEE